MMPIGPLMIEHRLIEKMIDLMKRELSRVERERGANPLFIDGAVDFIRTYADRCHHGKEEDILFRDLKTKRLSESHIRTMDELVEEHVWGRKTTGRLVDANRKYAGGNQEAITEIISCLRALTDFYPRHIEKEDKHFFIPVMEYFTEEEKAAMLQEGYEFDRNLIHERYKGLVNQFEAAIGSKSA
jgi:hemerythrin-like domain-containing protein